LNLQAIQSAVAFGNQLHQDLVTALTAFAHAHMEMHVKTLEMWTKTIEEIDNSSIEDDVDELVELMPRVVAQMQVHE
jgi:hypothetical protein